MYDLSNWLITIKLWTERTQWAYKFKLLFMQYNEPLKPIDLHIDQIDIDIFFSFND